MKMGEKLSYFLTNTIVYVKFHFTNSFINSLPKGWYDTET